MNWNVASAKAEDAGLLEKVELGRLQHLVVSHISEKNNLPELASGALSPVLESWSGDLHMADQKLGFDWIEVN